MQQWAVTAFLGLGLTFVVAFIIVLLFLAFIRKP